MASPDSKHGGSSASAFEVHLDEIHLQAKTRTLRRVESARVAITALALLMGLAVVGVSAHTLHVYHETSLSPAFLLPLWPDRFDVQPVVALVVGGVVVSVANMVALACSKVPVLRHNARAHDSALLSASAAALAAAVIATAVFYAADASATADTLLSWTCRWRAVPMARPPHWDRLCRESRAGLYLSVALVPVEAFALAAAAFQLVAERRTARSAAAGARKGSPDFS